MHYTIVSHQHGNSPGNTQFVLLRNQGEPVRKPYLRFLCTTTLVRSWMLVHFAGTKLFAFQGHQILTCAQYIYIQKMPIDLDQCMAVSGYQWHACCQGDALISNDYWILVLIITDLPSSSCFSYCFAWILNSLHLTWLKRAVLMNKCYATCTSVLKS